MSNKIKGGFNDLSGRQVCFPLKMCFCTQEFHRIMELSELEESLKISLFQNLWQQWVCVIHHSTKIKQRNLSLKVPELLILSSIPHCPQELIPPGWNISPAHSSSSACWEWEGAAGSEIWDGRFSVCSTKEIHQHWQTLEKKEIHGGIGNDLQISLSC